MNHYRIHDAVARLSHVDLQSTVSVLNALYVVSKTLEKRKEPGLNNLCKQLENALLPATLSSEGELRGLRAVPDRADVSGCYELCDMAEEYCFSELRLIKKHAPVELFLSIFGSPAQNYNSSGSQGGGQA